MLAKVLKSKCKMNRKHSSEHDRRVLWRVSMSMSSVCPCDEDGRTQVYGYAHYCRLNRHPTTLTRRRPQIASVSLYSRPVSVLTSFLWICIDDFMHNFTYGTIRTLMRFVRSAYDLMYRWRIRWTRLRPPYSLLLDTHRPANTISTQWQRNYGCVDRETLDLSNKRRFGCVDFEIPACV